MDHVRSTVEPMIKLELDPWLDHCPRAWQNFVMHWRRQQPCEHQSFTPDRINELLMPYQAQFHGQPVGPDPYVLFQTQAGYTWFQAVWS